MACSGLECAGTEGRIDMLLGSPGRGDNTTKHMKVKSPDVVQESKSCICGEYKESNGEVQWANHGQLQIKSSGLEMSSYRYLILLSRAVG